MGRRASCLYSALHRAFFAEAEHLSAEAPIFGKHPLTIRRDEQGTLDALELVFDDQKNINLAALWHNLLSRTTFDVVLTDDALTQSTAYQVRLEQLQQVWAHTLQEHEASVRRIAQQACEDPSGSGCFLTTAASTLMGHDDQGALLSLFRRFRDTYVAALPEGGALIAAYYQQAPQIVQRLQAVQDEHSLRYAYFRYLLPCAFLIKVGATSAALRTYTALLAYLSRKAGLALASREGTELA